MPSAAPVAAAASSSSEDEAWLSPPPSPPEDNLAWFGVFRPYELPLPNQVLPYLLLNPVRHLRRGLDPIAIASTATVQRRRSIAAAACSTAAAACSTAASPAAPRRHAAAACRGSARLLCATTLHWRPLQRGLVLGSNSLSPQPLATALGLPPAARPQEAQKMADELKRDQVLGTSNSLLMKEGYVLREGFKNIFTWAMWNSISAYLKDFGYQQSLLVQYQAASQKNMVTGEDTVR